MLGAGEQRIQVEFGDNGSFAKRKLLANRGVDLAKLTDLIESNKRIYLW